MEQPDFATNPHAVLSDRVVIAMVGLPARGKSYISKAIVRYLELLGCPARLFNAGNKRRQEGSAGMDAKFFDAANADAKQQRERMAMETLDELLVWLQNETRPDAGCACGIFDATNTTKARREKVRQRIARENPPVRLIFVESVCNDVATLENNYRMKLSNDDYRGTDPEAAYRDFKERVRQYEIVYEPVDDESECRPFCAEELQSRPSRADLLLHEGAGLHGVAVLVCRYRMDGGAKLGTGGLVRAYGGAAASSLLTAEMVEVVPLLAVRVRYPPEDVGVVYAALSAYSPRAAEALEGDAAAGAGLLEAMCEVPREAVDVLARTLRDATSGRAVLVAAIEAAPRTFTL